MADALNKLNWHGCDLAQGNIQDSAGVTEKNHMNDRRLQSSGTYRRADTL
jgi:hypothetical protein